MIIVVIIIKPNNTWFTFPEVHEGIFNKKENNVLRLKKNI